MPRGYIEGSFRNTGFPILLGEDAGKMLTDDLIRRVSLDPLRTGVPGCDIAARVEHVERVIRHAFDQCAQLVFVGLLRGRQPEDLAVCAQCPDDSTNHQAHRDDGPCYRGNPRPTPEFQLPLHRLVQLQGCQREVGSAQQRQRKPGKYGRIAISHPWDRGLFVIGRI